MKIYVNGAEVAEMAVSGDIDTVSDPVVMGRNVVSPAIAWDGLIDEISLYARALDDRVVLQIDGSGVRRSRVEIGGALVSAAGRGPFADAPESKAAARHCALLVARSRIRIAGAR